MRRAALEVAAFGLVAASALFPTAAAAQYCPCFTAQSPNNTYNCGVDAANGTNPTPTAWAPIFDLVAQGPSVWGNQGPAVADIGQGCGMPEATHNVAAKFPCEILKSIAMVESGWRQFCVPTTPSDQVGGPSRTIISFDCGYGIGQVTSGMHNGETPAFDRAKVASDPTYNLATGTLILADKWRSTNCVGDNQPLVVEDWYTAVWAYNGLAYVNNPTNPNYDAARGVYDPAVNNACPYQERVFGRIEHPTSGYWPSVALAYPKPSDCGGSGAPPNLPEPHCASPTNCASSRSVHATACMGSTGSTNAATTGASTGSAGTTTVGTASTGGSGQSNASSGAGVGGAATGAGGAASNSQGHGGCGCRVAGTSDESDVAKLATLALAAGLAARTRRRPFRKR